MSSTSADLRIASKRAYYDNNKPYGESETITLYIYNGGPDTAVAPVVTAGYTSSMDYDAVTTSLRQAQEYLGQQPSADLNSFNWTNLSSPSTHYEGWNMITTLPDVPPGSILDLGLTFPMTHKESYKDDNMSASVLSSTSDPRNQNISTTYIITPNHHNDGSAYWNTPGDLRNLDFNGLTSAQALSQADLRIASSRARYNNNLPYGQSETLSLLVFNAGPTIATKPVLTAGFTWSMDWTQISSSGQQVWIPDGVNPSTYLQGSSSSLQWQTLDGVTARVEDWNVVVSLPDIPPSILYRISIAFPMNQTSTYNDYTAPASISSQAQELDPSNNSTTYVITPNHDNDGTAYWNAPGDITQLDGPSTPAGSQACSTGWSIDTPVIVQMSGDNGSAQIPLRQLEGQISKTQIISYAPRSGEYQPKVVTGIEYDTSSSGRIVSFSADGKNVQSYVAHPDTLVYLNPFELNVALDKLRVAYWIPVRMLWAGAGVRGRSSTGGITTAYVTDIRIDTSGDQLQSAEPKIVSISHSYVVGTLQEGGILTHNPKDHERCGDPNNIAILLAISVLANNLVATTTPQPGNPDPPHGYSLRHRRPHDPIPPRIPAPPVLPIDVPRRDDEGNWLIYLYEEDTPAAVENARTAVYEFGLPSVLTYDPNNNAARRRQSTGQYQSQRELLQLTAEEASGSRGTLGQLDRDEYPPAIAAEGGRGALVTYIEAGDNRRAGSLMGQQFNHYRMDPQPDGHAPLRQGDRFRYAIIHENMSGVEYLGDGIDEDQLEEPPTD
ncbi:nuclease [Lentinula detonsa]|uniref:Nuclease n=1 Tax=Lentinula detonsa TaxID=2804962 RepID=A0A9W8U2I7_9AGAR|nr:nuclease [Lentinula detonsa]